MLFGLRVKAVIVLALFFALVSVCGSLAHAQTGDSSDGDDAVKLFERGQDAHARGDLAGAIKLYEEAIKLQPEFPEAEYQRGRALVALVRLPEAEKAFRRAIELREDWALPFAALGALLVRAGRASEAEPLLRRALELDAKNNVALVALAYLRLNAGANAEAVELAQRATAERSAPASAWAVRGLAEYANGNKQAAATSFDRALELDPHDVNALMGRAQLRADRGDYAHAIEDLKEALRLNPADSYLTLRLARVYLLSDNRDEARRVFASIDTLATTGMPAKLANEIEALRLELRRDDNHSAEPSAEEVAALEQQSMREPNNPKILAQLGSYYRTLDANRSLEYYRRASAIEPRNAGYATGYAAALVQARRFDEAVAILRRILNVEPENYAAHANLAISLYELKRFPESIEEYRWLLKSKPNLAVAHFFIATALDHMGQFQDALTEYQTFLAQADAQSNSLEIEKVNLRLPSLRQQIRNGQGVKKKRTN
ncbi:MAG: hypothetical protein AUG51_13585 [Acidobacteria bacterium 13_1_20CM_3_53_8]|nr:MAG: hypothetical protein AUG51_13585 [Acidobacteria bacterium 13_1_20CM_3_53_8]